MQPFKKDNLPDKEKLEITIKNIDDTIMEINSFQKMDNILDCINHLTSAKNYLKRKKNTILEEVKKNHHHYGDGRTSNKR